MNRQLHLFAAVLLGATSGACRYDIDKIYEDGEGVPDLLIELWRDQAFSTVDDVCAACAEERCADVNEACLADAECLALTSCVAESTDPVTQADCRSEHIDWLSSDIVGRDLGGPYQQCVFQKQCAAECGARTSLSCLGEFRAWPRTTDPSVSMRLRFVEALSNAPAAGVLVKVCRVEDIECTAPASMQTTDAGGVVQLDLPISLNTFQGFLELTEGGLYPTLIRFGWPLTQAGVTNLTVINDQSVQLSIGLARVEPDPERGLLQLRAFGCAGVAMPGIAFTSTGLDEQSRTWYAPETGPVPDFEATATATLGAGGIINVQAGLQTITASRLSDGLMVSQTAAPVRKGYMTIVLLAPLGQ